jgi:RHS repeat-associated protein
MTDGVGSENYAYNNLGQMTQLQKVISGTTYTTTYGYNTASELTQITYPSSRVVQQSVDAIGRLCEIAPATSGCGTASSPYATGYGYNAASQPTGFKYGNGIFASFGFSSDRLQLNCLDYSTTNRSGNCTHDSTTKFGLSYSYGAAGSNNGQIAGITDSVDSGRSATYTYDALYRLTTAVTTGSTGYPAWGLSESYDRYGNRSAQSIYSGCSGVACPTNSVTPDTATNRISGYSYDANGNMTNDRNNTLVYDAENRAVSATNGGGSGSYSYDGNNLRVKKVLGATTTVYIFSGSKVIAEYDNGTAPSSPSREYVYSGGALLVKIDSSGTRYYHQDHLSNRLVTDSNGNTLTQLGHYPFGESWYNASNDKLLFTTYERDAESGNDYALMRYGINSLARFSSPDPLSGSRGNPQSLNRYAYVHNDPINSTDPSGLHNHPYYFCSGDPPASTSGACNGPEGLFGGGGGGTCTYQPGQPCTIMGLEIFDAIAGVPGTYLYQDMYGNQGFGFSFGLYSATYTVIDNIRACVEDPSCSVAQGIHLPHQITDAGPYPFSGFQVVVTDSGGFADISGIIPDLLASQANLNQLMNIAIAHYNKESAGLSSDARQALFDKIFGNQALSDAVDRNAELIDQLIQIILGGSPVSQTQGVPQ